MIVFILGVAVGLIAGMFIAGLEIQRENLSLKKGGRYRG